MTTYNAKELNALQENEVDFRHAMYSLIEAMNNLAVKCWMPDGTRNLLRNIAAHAKAQRTDADIWIGFRDDIKRRKEGKAKSAELDFLTAFGWAVEGMTYSYAMLAMPTNGLPYLCLRRAASALATLTANY